LGKAYTYLRMRVLCVVSAIAAVGAQVCSPLSNCQTCTTTAGCVWGSSSGCVTACNGAESCVGVVGQCPLSPPQAFYATATVNPYPVYATAPAPVYATAPAPVYATASAPVYATAPAQVYATYQAAPVATYNPYATTPVYAVPYQVVPPVVDAQVAQNLYVSNANPVTTTYSGSPNPVIPNPKTPPTPVDCSKGRFVIGDDNYDTYCANYTPTVPYQPASVPYVTTTVPYVTATTVPYSTGTVLYSSG